MCLTGTASHSLEIFHNILFKSRTRAQLLSIVLENIRKISLWEFFEDGGFVSFDEQAHVCTSEQRNRALKMQRVEQLLFHGDNEPRLGKKYPPLAWILIWEGRYSNLFGYVIPDNMRLWGYIMWDVIRLEHTGVKDVLIRQFIEEHSEDPRTSEYWSRYNNDDFPDPDPEFFS